MTDPAASSAATTVVAHGLARRYRAERRFRLYGIAAISLALGFLVVMLVTIVSTGMSAFRQTVLTMEVSVDPEVLGIKPGSDPASWIGANYGGVMKQGIRALFPEVTERRQRRELDDLVSPGAAYDLGARLAADPAILGTTIELTVPAATDVDTAVKEGLPTDVPEDDRRLSDQQLDWVATLLEEGRLETRFNWSFFTNGDSREPELAGIRGAVVGSFLTLSVCLLLSFPIGVLAAVYLEAFAPKNHFTDLIEVNINNLAAVPSIVFGLLGLALFLNWVGLPRSAPLVGGMVLSLMTLPTIIIAARAAIKSVPPSIHDAALALGASPMQAVFHHVVPLAMPGILTGTIIGMAQALGESAPLLMIGMVAFIADVPAGITDPATALPVQVYLWADSPERAFVAKTGAAIMVLLAFLVTMNLTAIWLRKRFEQRF